MRDRSEPGGWAAIFAMIAAISLAQALQMSNGEYDPTALLLVGVTLVSLGLGVVSSTFPDPGPWSHQFIRTVGIAGVGLQLYQLSISPPGWYLHEVRMYDYLGLLAVFAALTGPVVVQFPQYRILYSSLWMAAFSAIGIWIIVASPNPQIDVFQWTHYSLDSLKSGKNPYALQMPNVSGDSIYWPDGSNWYGRPLSEDKKWVHVGYAYLPFSLMISGAGHVFGDMRLASLALLVAAGVSLLKGRGTYAVFGAALLLTMPRIFLVLQQAWTDAYCVGFLAITACLAARSSRWTPWFLGLTLVTKQYMVFLAPLGLLLIPAPWNRKKVALFIGQVILSGTIVTLPWILWNPSAWFDSVASTTVPFRPISLSIVVHIAHVSGAVPLYADILPFIMMLPAYLLIYRFSARGPAGFALSSALLLGMFVACSKTSYGSQYFLVLGLALTAFAMTRFKEQREAHALGDSGASRSSS